MIATKNFVAPSKVHTKTRIAYIDQIKNFLTCLVVAHHAAQAYGPTGGVWVVNDTQRASWLGQFFFINASYMMGLYFFISGYFMVFSVMRKSNKQFAVDRLKRLGIPLLFFTFLVFLPFNYFSADTDQNVFRFFTDTYFNHPPIATGHLWFVASLLVYSFIYLAFFRRLFSRTHHENRPFKLRYVIIYIILLTIISSIVRLKFPIDEWHTWLIPIEVAHLPQYLSLFLIGACFNHYGWLDKLTSKMGLGFLFIAISAYLTREVLPTTISNYWIMESLIESLLCVGISIALLTFFRQYINQSNSLSLSFSANAYGVYLFHLLIVIALQVAILKWEINANIKFIFVTVSAILLSYFVTALLRRIEWVRGII